MSSSQPIDSILNETRLFQPPAAQSLGFDGWHVGSMQAYRELHRRSIADPEGFWREEAGKLAWFKPFDRVVEWQAPDAKWFAGGATQRVPQLRRQARRGGLWR